MNSWFQYDLFLVPQGMKVETKATLLMAALVVVSGFFYV
jgi:hypothetical protein